MKTILLLLSFSLSAFVFGQNNSDNAPVQHLNNNGLHGNPILYNDENKALNFSYTPIATCDSGWTVVSVTGACSYNWYSDSALTMPLPSAPNGDLTTPPLYNDQTFWVEAQEPTGYDVTPMPASPSSYSGNVRGYWFQAPSNFTIVGLTVPTAVSTGQISAAIVRFNSGAPPLYSTTTNDFTLLGYWPQAVDDTIFACIPVQAGDYIGVLGNRGGINAYSPSPTTTTIDGNSVTITRCGMQFAIATTAPQDLWQESGGSISEVELLIASSWTTSVESVTVAVPQSYNTTLNSMICQGDSVYAGGAYQTSSGTYTDSLVRVNGCDSIIVTNLSVDIIDNSVTQSPGTLSANQGGVSYQWIDCISGNPVSGETSQSFVPVANGTYAVVINDSICSDTSACYTVNDVGLTEIPGWKISAYPNPVSDQLIILSNQAFSDAKLSVHDLSGKVVLTMDKISGETITVDMSDLSQGAYTIRILSGEQVSLTTVIRK